MKDIIELAKFHAFKSHDLPSECQRYGNEPYSKHLQDVVEVAKKYIHYINESDRDTVIASCYLHDVVEDTANTPNDLKRMFNREIADIVYRVSNERGLSKKAILFKTLPKIWENELAIYVKLSDRIANGTNSRNGFDKKSAKLYARYKGEYSIFRFALRIPNEETGEIMYPEMWAELDEIFEFKSN